MSTTKVTDAMRDVTEVDAAKITTGTLPEARITSLAATKLTGTITPSNDTVDGAQLNPSLVTGDIIYSDGTDSIERLAKPASPAGEVLTFATSATAPSWVAPAAGAVTKILSTTISSSVAAVAFNSTYVTSTYSYYKLIWEGLSVDTTSDEIGILLSVDNGSTFATHENMHEWAGSFASGGSTGWTSVAYHKIHGDVHATIGGGGSSGIAHIWNANSTAEYKFIYGASCDYHNSGDYYRYESWTAFKSTTAVNYIKIYNVNGNNLDAGKATLYGFE
jgi:hypothetical protein